MFNKPMNFIRRWRKFFKPEFLNLVAYLVFGSYEIYKISAQYFQTSNVNSRIGISGLCGKFILFCRYSLIVSLHDQIKIYSDSILSQFFK